MYKWMKTTGPKLHLSRGIPYNPICGTKVLVKREFGSELGANYCKKCIKFLAKQALNGVVNEVK